IARTSERSCARINRSTFLDGSRAINKEIHEEVVPVIEGTEEQYRQTTDSDNELLETTDSAYTSDGWAERIIAAINAIANRYTGPQSVFRG
ncbi:hypothetical protein, partial [Escherichia coli]|uniref:hypothetical protein n=1 Tax=Escherichia coli TaxID=562 RepID=UPI001BFDDEE1